MRFADLSAFYMLYDMLVLCTTHGFLRKILSFDFSLCEVKILRKTEEEKLNPRDNFRGSNLYHM
jgi:hypothetical protein